MPKESSDVLGKSVNNIVKKRIECYVALISDSL